MDEQELDAHNDSDEVRELESVFASLSAILILVDAHQVIRRWNQAAERALEFAAEDVVGLPIYDCGVRWKEEELRELTSAIGTIGDDHRLKLSFENAGGERRTLGISLTPIEPDRGEGRKWILLGRDITEQMSSEELRRRLMTAVEQVEDTIVITSTSGKITYANPAFERSTGYSLEEAIGRPASILKSGKHDAKFYEELWATLGRGQVWSGHLTNRRKDGSFYEEDATISPVRDDEGQVTYYVAVKKDVTERLAMEIQLRTAQKLESIGQLAAGIAHEINTPTQFISDNTKFLRDAFERLGGLLDQCAELEQAGGEVGDPQRALDRILALAKSAKIQFIREEIPAALADSLGGLERVAEIVSAMKSFSHPGTDEMQAIDLNEAIKTTVTLSTNEWKNVAEIETDLDPNLPPVECYPGEIGQVLLNVIVNAGHAVEEVVGRGGKRLGKITIRSRMEGKLAEVRISDTGCGIKPESLTRIFDPFYTTKEVGRGTGQGLAISRSVIVDKHLGSIDVESEPGQGSCFIIRVPIRDARAAAEAA